MLLLDGKRYYITGDTEPVAEMAGLNADVIFPLLYGCGANLDLAVRWPESANLPWWCRCTIRAGKRSLKVPGSTAGARSRRLLSPWTIDRRPINSPYSDPRGRYGHGIRPAGLIDCGRIVLIARSRFS